MLYLLFPKVLSHFIFITCVVCNTSRTSSMASNDKLFKVWGPWCTKSTQVIGIPHECLCETFEVCWKIFILSGLNYTLTFAQSFLKCSLLDAAMAERFNPSLGTAIRWSVVPFLESILVLEIELSFIRGLHSQLLDKIECLKGET